MPGAPTPPEHDVHRRSDDGQDPRGRDSERFCRPRQATLCRDRDERSHDEPRRDDDDTDGDIYEELIERLDAVRAEVTFTQAGLGEDGRRHGNHTTDPDARGCWVRADTAGRRCPVRYGTTLLEHSGA